MSSNSNNDTKLILTAVGAAFAGAGAALAAMKMAERRRTPNPSRYPPLMKSRNSFVFDTSDDSTRGTASVNANNTIIYPHNHEAKMARQIAARAAVEEENRIRRQSVTVRVPATSANMGPGCECYNDDD